MALTIRQPTANQSPDPGQGGLAVTSPSDTGHASSVADCTGELCNDFLTCIWSGFQLVSGIPTAITLKITHTSSGTLSGVTAANAFTLEYSLNGGASWNTAVSRSNFTSAQGPTVFSVALPVGQDLTQVRVRDLIRAVTDSLLGHTATASATIADIQIEVVTQDQQPITLW